MPAKNKGGRPPGSKNKQSKITSLAAKYDLLPLDYMLRILNHDNSTNTEDDEPVTEAMRMDAAKSAAPYIHARLQSVTVQERPFEGDPNEFTNEYLAGIIAGASSSNATAKKKGSRTTH